MIPAQAIPMLGGPALIIGGIVFMVILVGIVGIFYWMSFGGTDEPWTAFYDAAEAVADHEDADAMVFIPYSDGPLVPKPAIYDREVTRRERWLPHARR